MNEASEEMPDRHPMFKKLKRATGGAVGAGAVLILLPSLALVAGLRHFADVPSVGLPVLAIFGIMILFGALALISTLFARLNLQSKGEALALPPGSIRAAIALSLIVLFALISVMLYESMNRPYKVEYLREADKAALVREPTNHVTAVIPRECGAIALQAKDDERMRRAGAPMQCADTGEILYTVHLRQTPGTESSDMAKQLLILIGTLMTSVVSYYFASRSAEASTKTTFAALTRDAGGTQDAGSREGADEASGIDGSTGPRAEDNMDGCSVPIDSATKDEDLPPSRGGVLP